jgi:transcriptional regulator with GAF, ATPase, and Fis domain
LEGHVALLVMSAGGVFTFHLPPDGEVTIGRADTCGVVVRDPELSREHARLRAIGGERFEIVDLGSSNGTRVGDTQCEPDEPLDVAPGQVVSMGTTVIMLQLAPPESRGRPNVVREEAAPQVGALERLRPMVSRFAAGTIPVLILGETGVGKEVLASMIHALSPRASRPLVCLNCAALPETLLESELFGHERGAFTGAVQAKQGILEAAKGGTVFLDELAEMPLGAQAKLLRVIDQREVMRLGTTTPHAIDVRFLAATNKDLEAEVLRGAFREDLFYRLNAAQIVIPPLRSRRDEIAPLARTFVADACKQMGRADRPRLSGRAIALLEAYAWPGNVRELRNTIERAVLLAQDDILPEHLPAEKLARRAAVQDADATAPRPVVVSPPLAMMARKNSTVRPATRPGQDAEAPTLVSDPEQDRVLRVLEQCDWNQTQAAEALGISRRTLVSRLGAWGWTRPRRKMPPA